MRVREIKLSVTAVCHVTPLGLNLVIVSTHVPAFAFTLEADSDLMSQVILPVLPHFCSFTRVIDLHNTPV